MKPEPANETAERSDVRPPGGFALRAVLEPEDVLREIGRRVGLDLLPPGEEAAREAALARIARLEPELLSALACAMLAEELRASRQTAGEDRFPFLPARTGARIICQCGYGHDTAAEAMVCPGRKP